MSLELKKHRANKDLTRAQKDNLKALSKKFVDMPKLSRLIWDQLKDVRNAAIREECGLERYPIAFKLEGKALEDSQKDRDARKKEIGKAIDAFLEMPKISAVGIQRKSHR